MANRKQLAVLKKGPRTWNQWREDNPGIEPDFSGANLVGAYLYDANLHDANLSRANLRDANLRIANLRNADLRKADLSLAGLDSTYLRDANLIDANLSGAFLCGANLAGARFCDANLTKADLSEAGLRDANLTRANLSEALLIKAEFFFTDVLNANFHGARLAGTTFKMTNFTKAEGLSSCKHHGPSYLDGHTLMVSVGLPDAFLRGCGLPDILIDYLPSLTGRAIEFYSCFISYSTRDQEFSDRLHADLQAKGVRCWFAPHDMQGGKKLHEQIDQAIRVHDKLLLILSDASMASEWVKTEIAKARKREARENRRMLFPVRLVEFSKLRDWECFDADAGKDSAREIREYYVPDFSNWKDHDSYQREFNKLLRDLKSTEQHTAARRADES